MAFNSFDRGGHRMLSAEIQSELAAFALRHGLTVTAGGGSIGSDSLTIKVECKTADKQAIEAKARQEIGWYGKQFGLVPDDYGAAFSHKGERYRFIGINANAPKYPIQGERIRDGQGIRFTRNFASQIVAARQAKPAPIAQGAGAPQPAAPAMPAAANSNFDGAFDDVAQF